MKPQLSRGRKPPSPASAAAAGQQLSLAFHDELVATIHGAFEVAVDIAVLEVTKLVGQAMGDLQLQMQRENESLKQRLQKAEETLECVRGCTGEVSGNVSAKQLVNASRKPQDCPPAGNPKQDCVRLGGSTPLKQANPPPDPQDNHATKNEAAQPSTNADVKKEPVNGAAVDPEEEQSHGYFSEICENGQIHSKEIPSCASRKPAVYGALLTEPSEDVSDICVAKVESPHQTCQDPAAQHRDLLPLPGGADTMTSEQVSVKEERAAEMGDTSGCCFDSIGAEDFGPESLSLVQTKMLEEWKPELLDVQSQEADELLALAHPPNMTTSVSAASDLPPVSSEFPDIFQPTEPAAIPADPPQVYGVSIRTGRNLGHPSTGINACKICGQTFQQPSLLRRHYGQCQQRLQQGFRQPVQGTKRTKLQLYPPGCSPFRCTECNREFNRLENLKTHLRIHTGERPYTCSVCSKCFRHSGALTRHFRIHTGEKPYVCGQCGKSFRNCGGLKFHQRSHSRQ